MHSYLSHSLVSAFLLFTIGFIWPSEDLNTDTHPNSTMDSEEFQPVSDGSVRMVIASAGNTARYLVREQLAGFDFPNDAVGETDAISGAVVFTADGEINQDESSIVVDITELTSDRDRRDGFIQRRTLESETYPTVELVPIQTRGLEFPLPSSGTATFDIVGYLTIKDVTEVTSWRVTAQFNNGNMTGTARTEFTFDEFGMEKPSVGSVLSVADAIRLELDFIFNIEQLAAN
jgi:hypothetical protein